MALSKNHELGTFANSLDVNQSTGAVTSISIDTDAVSEGSSNQYFTNERVDDRVNALLQAGSNITLTYDDASNTLTIASTDTEDDLSNNTTSDLAEGTNLYYTDARFDTRLATKTTANLTEGSNLYFTNARARASISLGTAGTQAYNNSTGVLTVPGTSDHITEGSINLFYTDARVATYIGGNRTYGDITTTGSIKGPATLTIDPAAIGDNTGTVVIAGDLTVNGTTTTVNSNTVNIGDNILVLNSDETGVPSQDAGLEVERGTSTNVSLKWNETSDKWQFTNDGSTYVDIGTASIFTGNTDGITEGSSNLYYTDARADTRATLRITAADIGNLNNVDETGVANNKILKYNSTSSKWEVADDAGGIADLVDDTTPQLGGNLDLNSKNITGTGSIDISGALNISSNVYFSGQLGLGSSNATSPECTIFIAGNSTTNISDSDSLFGFNRSSFIKLENENNTSGVETGIILRAKQSLAGVWAIYAKHTGNYTGDLIFRGRNAQNTNAEVLRLKHDGKVGIGTTTPGTTLEVHSGGATSFIRARYNSGYYTDFNTNGINFTGTSQSFSLQDNGSTKLKIASGGNVGIGTDTPGEKLVVHGDGARITVESADYEVAMLGRRGSSGSALDSGYLRLRKVGVTSTGIVLDTDGPSWLNGGNVGIGTSSPATSYGKVLHIHDTGTSGANLRLTDATSGAGTGNGLDIIQLGVDSYIINRELGDMSFYTGGQSRITIHADGHLGFGDSVLNDSAWSTVFGARSQWDTMGVIAATDGSMQIGHNWYYDAGGSTGYKYIAGGKANRQIHVNDYISWEMTNSTGSAGGEITFVEVMKLTANGNLGIGNVYPAHPLHIYEDGGYYASIGRGNSTPGGTDPWLGLYDNVDIASSTFGWGIYDSSADGSLQIWNKNNNATGTNTFTIKRGGNVGIGTNNPNRALTINGGNDAKISFQGGGTQSLYFGDGAGSAEYAGYIHYAHSDDQMRFHTSTDFYFSGGNIGIGTSDPTTYAGSNGGMVIYRAGGSSNAMLSCANTTGSGTMRQIDFFQGTSTGRIGAIESTTTATTYLTTSDRRLKENIKQIQDASQKILAMNPVSHTWIKDKTAPAQYGFIAQEMQSIVPEAVSGDADSDEMMQMDYGRITPVIVKSLQDALQEISSLKQQISKLEEKINVTK